MAAEEGELVHKQVVLLLFKAVQKLRQPWKKHVGAIFYFQLMLFGMFVLKTEWLVIRYQALLYTRE